MRLGKLKLGIFVSLVIYASCFYFCINRKESMENKLQQTLTALVVSDTHDDVSGITTIKKDLREKGTAIDFVICPGDLTTMPNKDYKVKPDAKELKDYAKKVETLLKCLETIPKDAGKVYWIPGNHDPLPLFDASSSESKSMPGVNVHEKVVEIAPGLVISGMGGCVEAIEDSKVVWTPYPLPEKEIEPKFEKLGLKINEILKGKRSSLIVVTHSGPDLSSTVKVSGFDSNHLHAPGVRKHIVNSGSPSLSKLLCDTTIQENCVLMLHGHTHQAMGLSRIGSVPVLNPGSTIHSGTYALITFKKGSEKAKETHQKSDERGPWKISDINIRTFDA